MITLFLAKIYIENQNEKKLYSTFEKTRQEITTNIANVMIKPLENFSPSEASSALEVVKQDSKIVKVYIHDSVLDSCFIHIYIPARIKSSLYQNHQIIYNDKKEQLGFIEISFNDAHIKEQLEELNKVILVVLTFAFIIIFTVILILLYFKVFMPLKTLLKQAKNFQNNELQNGYEWKSNDELSNVGKSFELARISILSLLKQLSDKNEELEELYVIDKLTGVYNRHKLDITLEHEENIHDRYNQSFGIILIDIDDFKYVNDTYGHLVGDRVLVEIASILKSNIRKTDILGRWGGEEFLVIVPQSNKEDLFELSCKLKDCIADHDFKLSKKVTASIGLSLYEKDLVTLIKNADDALYQIKRTGKNNILFKSS